MQSTPQTHMYQRHKEVTITFWVKPGFKEIHMRITSHKMVYAWKGVGLVTGPPSFPPLDKIGKFSNGSFNNFFGKNLGLEPSFAIEGWARSPPVHTY